MNLQMSKKAILLSDAICNLCRDIVIEPVNIPCGHHFCFLCFQSSLNETSYSCAICRKRLSNYLRTHNNKDKLINHALWKHVQEQFSREIELRKGGIDGFVTKGLREHLGGKRVISEDGEIGKEFRKMMEELGGSQKEVRHSQSRNREILLKRDEEFAKKLDAEFKKKEMDGPSSNTRSANVQKTAKGEKKTTRDPRLTDVTPLRCESTDSLLTETCHFEPIVAEPKTPVKNSNEASPRKIPPVKFLLNLSPSLAQEMEPLTENKIVKRSKLSAFTSTQPEDGNETPLKKAKVNDDNSENIGFQEVNYSGTVDVKQQIESDRLFAENLHKKLNSVRKYALRAKKF